MSTYGYIRSDIISPGKTAISSSTLSCKPIEMTLFAFICSQITFCYYLLWQTDLCSWSLKCLVQKFTGNGLPAYFLLTFATSSYLVLFTNNKFAFVPFVFVISRFTLSAVDSRGSHSESSFVSVRTSCPMVDDSRAEGTLTLLTFSYSAFLYSNSKWCCFFPNYIFCILRVYKSDLNFKCLLRIQNTPIII